MSIALRNNAFLNYEYSKYETVEFSNELSVIGKILFNVSEKTKKKKNPMCVRVGETVGSVL